MFTTMSVVGGFERSAMKRFPPLAAGSMFLGSECFACAEPFVLGDVLTGIPLGPGSDPEARELARARTYYDCLAVAAHAECAGL